MKYLLATKRVRILDCCQDTAKFPRIVRGNCVVLNKKKERIFGPVVYWPLQTLRRVGNGGITPCILKLCSLYWGVSVLQPDCCTLRGGAFSTHNIERPNDSKCRFKYYLS
jgi:hypothetical protein